MTSAEITTRSRVRSALLSARRLWWIAPALVALVAIISLARYAGPGAATDEPYIATRSLHIIVVPTGAARAYDTYAAARQADEIARNLATGTLLANPHLDAAIATTASAQRRAGMVSARDVAAALSATHTGSVVTLTARGHTPVQADTLATAAVATMTSAAFAASLPQTLAPPVGTSVEVVAEGSTSSATLDVALQQAAVRLVVTRLVLALLAGLLLTLLVGWWLSLPPRAAPAAE